MGIKLRSEPLFPITSGSQDEYIETGTISQLLSGWSLTSREFSYNDIFQNSNGMIGLAVSCSGDSNDKLGIKLSFSYGGSLGYIKEVTLMPRTSNGLACNSSGFYRIDINKDFRNAIPFDKMKIVLGKYGDNADCTVKARLIIL